MLPLTAGGSRQPPVQDLSLEVERTRILNELAMIRDVIEYVVDSISVLQSHNQLRVELICDHKALKGRERLLGEHLRDIKHEIERATTSQDTIEEIDDERAWKLEACKFFYAPFEMSSIMIADETSSNPF